MKILINKKNLLLYLHQQTFAEHKLILTNSYQIIVINIKILFETNLDENFL